MASCISLVRWGKFLAAKLNLTIWSSGQQALASLQAQDLSDAGIFHWGHSTASSNVERCILRVALADNHPERRGKKPTCSQGLQKAGDWDQPLEYCPEITGHWCAYGVLGLVCPAERAAVACISTGQRVKCLTAKKSQKKRDFLLLCF